MPLQNRVTPLNEIVAVAERGMLFMGNRGCLHDGKRKLVRQIRSERRWIICQTSFNGRKRVLMSPGEYTELFFLDEATALAAGHRPCYECRRTDYNRFKTAWLEGNPSAGLNPKCSINDIDAWLHEDRLTSSGHQRTHDVVLGDLPPGTFVTLPDHGRPLLYWQGRLFAWTPGGYKPGPPTDANLEVVVRTPKSTVNALRAGYVPVVHQDHRDLGQRDRKG